MHAKKNWQYSGVYSKTCAVLSLCVDRISRKRNIVTLLFVYYYIMNIGFIGTGKLGVCLAGVLSKKGFNVESFDRKIKSQNHMIKSLREDEPGLKKLKKYIKNIKVKKNLIKAVSGPQITFICIDTPSLETGEYDTSGLFAICDEIKEAGIKNKILVIVCTTNPGDCKKIQNLLAENKIKIVYTPEFIAQGSIISDLQSPDIAIYGGDKASIKKVSEIYKRIYKKPKTVKSFMMSSAAAELVKISINSFLTIKISFANCIGRAISCLDTSDEIKIALEAIGSDSRVGKKFLDFGFGFGGPCLPRDNIALTKSLESRGIEFHLGLAADKYNKDHEDFLVNMLITQNVEDLPFLFDSVFYKKGVKIDCPSQKKNICKKLIDKGYEVFLQEPSLDEELNKKVNIGTPKKNFFDVRIR